MMRKFPPALKENKLEINPYGLTIFPVVFGSTHTEYTSYHNRKAEKTRNLHPQKTEVTGQQGPASPAGCKPTDRSSRALMQNH